MLGSVIAKTFILAKENYRIELFLKVLVVRVYARVRGRAVRGFGGMGGVAGDMGGAR